MALLEGIIAATFTPFHDDGTLKLEAIPEYVDYLIEGGVRGLYVCGTTGEGIGLTIEERKKTSEAFLKAADGRVPVVVQVVDDAVKGGGLASPRRPAGQDHAMRQPDHAGELLGNVGFESESVQRDLGGGLLIPE